MTRIDAGDVLIVGAGLAGLYTALELAPRSVTVLCAREPGVGACSVWAQAGIAAAIGADDTPRVTPPIPSRRAPASSMSTWRGS